MIFGDEPFVLDRHYKAFIISDSPDAFDCVVNCSGDDDSLFYEPLEKTRFWSFDSDESSCVIKRRNPQGEVIWRIQASLSAEEVTITWNPNCFKDYYESCSRALSEGLGLTLFVLRLRSIGGLVFHGASAVLNGEAILCVGVSGVGKSTISRLLAAAGAKVLSDEHPIIRQCPAPDPGVSPSIDFRVYGTPWPSSAGFARNESAPLKRIYFLEHGPDNQITRVSARDAIARLIHVAIIPWQDPRLFDPCLQTVEALLANVPVAVLSFRPDEDVVNVIRRDLAADCSIG